MMNSIIVRTKTFHEFALIQNKFKESPEIEVAYINTFQKLSQPHLPKDPNIQFTIFCIDKRISKRRIEAAGYSLDLIIKGWKGKLNIQNETIPLTKT